MGHEFSEYALGAVALLVASCSGRSILVDTASAGAPQVAEIADSGRSEGSNGKAKPESLNSAGADGKGGSDLASGGTSDTVAGSGGTSYTVAGSGGTSDTVAGSGGAGDTVAGSSGAGDTVAGSSGAPAGGGAAGAPTRPSWVAFDREKTSVFEETGAREIWLATVDQLCFRPLVVGPGHAKQAAFSADGKQLAFASDNTGTYQIYVMNLASGERTQITNEAQGATYPSWSPDAQRIAYVTGDPEKEYDSAHPLDGSGTLKLVDPISLVTTVLAADGHPAYAGSAFASNSLILVSRMVSVVGIHIDTLERYDVAPETASASLLTSPSISPDGSQFVLAAQCGITTYLYVARIDGTTGTICEHGRPLERGRYGPTTSSWGPDGYIAAGTWNGDLIVVPSDGPGGAENLANSSNLERNPAFAPPSFSISCKE